MTPQFLAMAGELAARRVNEAQHYNDPLQWAMDYKTEFIAILSDELRYVPAEDEDKTAALRNHIKNAQITVDGLKNAKYQREKTQRKV